MPAFMRLAMGTILTGMALAVTPHLAHAQIGGFLKKKIADKAAEQAASKAAERMGVEQAGGLRVAPVDFNESVLEITDARLDAFLAIEQVPAAAKKEYPAWAAEQERTVKDRSARYEGEKREYDRRLAAHEAERAAYEKAAHPHEECKAKASGAFAQAVADPAAAKMAVSMNTLSPAEQEAFSRRMEAREKRMQQAQASGDMQLVMAIRDSADADMQKTLGVSMAELQAAGARTSAAHQQMQAAQAKCGPAPVEPPPFRLAEPLKPDQVLLEEQYIAMRVAQAITAAGMDENSYAVLRERLEAFASGKDAKSGSGIFTESEVKVLEARYEDLKPAVQARKRFKF